MVWYDGHHYNYECVNCGTIVWDSDIKIESKVFIDTYNNKIYYYNTLGAERIVTFQEFLEADTKS